MLATFEVTIVVLLKIQVFWDVTLHHLVTIEYMAAFFTPYNSCNSDISCFHVGSER